MHIHKALVMLALASLLVLGTAADDEPVRIGVVDIDQAISSTDEGKAAREEFARKQREAEAKIQPMVERYRELEEDLKAKKFVLSDDALYQKRLEGPLTKKLVEIIEEAGKSRGFTLILRRGAPGVLYSREALDITDVIIEKYNQKS